MKQAKVITVLGSMTPNGREKKMQLRAGANGKGKILHTVGYWPWSDRSIEEADRMIAAAAQRHQVEIVPSEPE